MKYLSLLSVLFVLISCSSDDDSSIEDSVMIEEETVDPGFYGLAVGNTWSYEAFIRSSPVGSPLEFEPNGISWTIEITSTIDLDGKTYYERTFTTTGNDSNSGVFPENGVSTDRVRDSLGYLIRDNGFILFSSQETTPYLLNTAPFGDTFGQLLDEPSTILVDAGSFRCLQNELYALLNPDGERSPGTSRYYFTEGIGTVQQNIAPVSRDLPIWRINLTSFESVVD